MYAYIDRKKKFPVTTLLRAPLDIHLMRNMLNLFELADDLYANDINESIIGRRIATDVIDMETGEIIATRHMIITPE